MKRYINTAYLRAIFCALALLSPARGAGECPRTVAAADSACNVWVFFNGRPEGSAARISERAAQRRQRAGFAGGDDDRPVSRYYIDEVRRLGGALRHEFPWGNAASFSVPSARLSEIAALPFVDSVAPVAIYVRKDAGDPGPGEQYSAPMARSSPASASSAPAAAPSFVPEGYDWHTEMLNIPAAHEYLKAKGLGVPGRGVLIAFFDSGFRLGHPVFSRLGNGGIAAARDFVDGDASVYSPDSVAGDTLHPYHHSDRHGSQVLALAAGYHEGVYVGAAWGARFVLARTEDIGVESRVEEDNWAAAAVWADSAGADIISSSLGYRFDFDDPSEDYGYGAMNGATTVISKAAAAAAARGIIVVNAMGNEGGASAGTLIAPADVESVVSVGAVNRAFGLYEYGSVGPTYDGRVKPDVVAPGVRVPLPVPYSAAGVQYTTGSGTSLATPMVSGTLALVLQAVPGISAAAARERLYASCSFLPRQTGVDNRFGRGLPNALRAVMAEDEIFIRITDSAGRALAGAEVRGGGAVYTVGESGALLLRAPPAALPMEFRITFRGTPAGAFTVDTLPFETAFAAEVSRDDGFALRPSFVKKNRAVKGIYHFSGTDLSAPATAAVYTLNGRKVWDQKLRVRPDGSAEFVWEAGKIAAGVYLLTVRHGHNQVSGRIVVTD